MRFVHYACRSLSALAVLAALTRAVSARADLEVGQVAPDFALPDQNGKVHRLSDYKGKYVVLAFYPKDMTAG
jgi:cytochrome oxidase Cu insertion factor (SCO1/SenC/PrrC family)